MPANKINNSRALLIMGIDLQNRDRYGRSRSDDSPLLGRWLLQLSHCPYPIRRDFLGVPVLNQLAAAYPEGVETEVFVSCPGGAVGS